jgi:fatty-acid peroxygenase
MGLMAPEALERLRDLTAEAWVAAVGRWESAGEVVLLDEVHEVLCRAVCAWAGVPLEESDAARRAADFAAMIDGAGAIGPRNIRGHLARRRAEAWLQGIVERLRAGELEVAHGSAAQVIADHRGSDGELLEPEVATVELINVLRPTVAVGRFVMFAALALHEHPDSRDAVRGGEHDHVIRASGSGRRSSGRSGFETGAATRSRSSRRAAVIITPAIAAPANRSRSS